MVSRWAVLCCGLLSLPACRCDEPALYLRDSERLESFEVTHPLAVGSTFSLQAGRDVGGSPHSASRFEAIAVDRVAVDGDCAALSIADARSGALSLRVLRPGRARLRIHGEAGSLTVPIRAQRARAVDTRFVRRTDVAARCRPKTPTFLSSTSAELVYALVGAEGELLHHRDHRPWTIRPASVRLVRRQPWKGPWQPRSKRTRARWTRSLERVTLSLAGVSGELRISSRVSDQRWAARVLPPAAIGGFALGCRSGAAPTAGRRHFWPICLRASGAIFCLTDDAAGRAMASGRLRLGSRTPQVCGWFRRSPIVRFDRAGTCELALSLSGSSRRIAAVERVGVQRATSVR